MLNLNKSYWNNMHSILIKQMENPYSKQKAKPIKRGCFKLLLDSLYEAKLAPKLFGNSKEIAFHNIKQGTLEDIAVEMAEISVSRQSAGIVLNVQGHKECSTLCKSKENCSATYFAAGLLFYPNLSFITGNKPMLNINTGERKCIKFYTRQTTNNWERTKEYYPKTLERYLDHYATEKSLDLLNVLRETSEYLTILKQKNIRKS